MISLTDHKVTNLHPSPVRLPKNLASSQPGQPVDEPIFCSLKTSLVMAEAEDVLNH